MKRLFITLICLFSFSIAHAQDATPEAAAGWTIEQRCVGEPTTPPDDWSFDGTILMTSPQQLHAYQQGWETPRILIFTGESHGTYSGQLSPDGRWYAVIDGYRQRNNMIFTWQIEAVHIYSTLNDIEYLIPWNDSFSGVNFLEGQGLYWIGNEQLLYSMSNDSDEVWFLINPFTEQITEWEAFNPTWGYFFLSPDGTKAIYTNGGGTSILYNREREIEVNLYDPVWHPDSSQFAGYSLQQNTSAYIPDYLVLFDLEGHVTDEIFYVGGNNSFGFPLWSPDGRYLSFSIQNQLYIADTQAQIVIDTCTELHSSSSVWSPTSSQIAFIEYYNRQYTLQVFDFNTWQRYIVAYHQGDVIGWRADD